MKNSKKMKITLYVLVATLFLTISVCTFLITKDVILRKQKRKEYLENTIIFKPVELECDITTTNINQISPIYGCKTSRFMVDKITLAGVDTKLEVTFDKYEDDLYTINLKLDDQEIISDNFLEEAHNFYHSEFSIFEDSLLVIKSDTGDQIGTSNITIINNEKELLLNQREVIINNQENKTFTIHKYHMLDMECNDLENQEETYEIVTKYQIENNQINLIDTKNITCQEYNAS